MNKLRLIFVLTHFLQELKPSLPLNREPVWNLWGGGGGHHLPHSIIISPKLTDQMAGFTPKPVSFLLRKALFD